MKRFLLLVFSAFMIAGLCLAAPVPKATDKKKAVPAAKEVEKEGTIEGISIKRANGTWLGVRASGGVLGLAFYDEKKNPVLPDVPRASARWNPSTKTGSQFAVLNPSGDGRTLIANKPIQPPFNFKLFLTLLAADGNAIESHVIDFRQ